MKDTNIKFKPRLKFFKFGLKFDFFDILFFWENSELNDMK